MDEMGIDTPLDARIKAAGIEVYFSLVEVGELLQIGQSSLRYLLIEHKAALAPPTYRRARGGRRYRCVSATDVKLLQDLLFQRGHCTYSGRPQTKTWPRKVSE
jgi:hypothetical protein